MMNLFLPFKTDFFSNFEYYEGCSLSFEKTYLRENIETRKKMDRLGRILDVIEI